MGVYRLKFPRESTFLIRIQITFYLENEFVTTCIILICLTFLAAPSSCPSCPFQCVLFLFALEKKVTTRLETKFTTRF